MSDASAQHWRSSQRILFALLAVWFLVSFVCGIFFVEPLNEYHLGGFPLGFWFAQQGSIYVFVVLILIYALLMDRLDRQLPSQTGSGDDAGPSDQGGDA